jgi:PilZ domain
MTKNQSQTQTATNPEVQIIAKVVCAFSDNDTRVLFATNLSMLELSIISLSPPPVYSTFSLAIYPRGHAVLPPMQARVVATYLDPDDASKSGFRAVFARPSDRAVELLGRTLLRLKIINSSDLRATLFERRRDPRVRTDLNALVETAAKEQYNLRLLDLSVSGAFLVFDDASLLDRICVGDELSIDVLEESMPERISVKAVVVRMARKAGSVGVGVRFTELDRTTLSRLEGVILQVLCKLDLKGFEIAAV